MNVLVVGGGAREHVMCSVICKNAEVKLFSVMKNINPGIADLAESFLVEDECKVDSVVEYAKSVDIDLAFVGPEAPLQAGLADSLSEAGIGVCAPIKDAARIETDKQFMRKLCEEFEIDGRLGFGVFEDEQSAKEFMEGLGGEVAIKPIGLTGGKGVQVSGDHFEGVEGGMKYVSRVLSEGIGGSNKVLIEQKAVGEEFTVMGMSDGKNVVCFPAVQDHKRLLPDDKGPNTGGMGSYSCSNGLLPFLSVEEYDEGVRILHQIVAALSERGCAYVGPIYGQFMATADGVKLIEINARFGDPENMNVLSLLRSDFVGLGVAALSGSLKGFSVEFEKKATVLKYVVPEGYGVKSMVGVRIVVDEEAIKKTGALLYYASVNESEEPGVVLSTSSRSLAIVGVGDDLNQAEKICESALGFVKSDHIFVRHDIGSKELVNRRVLHMKKLRGV